MSSAQTGIFEESSTHHWFLEYYVAGGTRDADLRRCLRAALSAPDSPSGREIHRVIGFGDALWRRLAPDSIPGELRPFRAVEGVGGHRAPATQRAIWFWIHSRHPDETFAGGLQIHQAMKDTATLELEEQGFRYRDSRDLTGFVDGTANPKGDDRRQVALLPDGAAGSGGSFVLAQRWVHDLPSFHSLSVEEQERVIGRTKSESVELEGDAMPVDAHVHRTDLKKDGVALKLYRRSIPFGTVREHGLYFLGFACDPVRFEAILDSMFGVSGDGVHDRLMEFSRPTSGGLYFAPSQEDLARVLE